MSFDNCSADGQAQPKSGSIGTRKWFEDRRSQFSGHPWTRIVDSNAQPFRRAACVNPNLLVQATRVLQGGDRITNEI